MPDGEFISFIPVDEDVAHNVKQWKHMPLPALCTRLKDKSAAVLRTDSDTVEGKAPAGAKIVPDKKKLYFDVWF